MGAHVRIWKCCDHFACVMWYWAYGPGCVHACLERNYVQCNDDLFGSCRKLFTLSYPTVFSFVIVLCTRDY